MTAGTDGALLHTHLLDATGRLADITSTEQLELQLPTCPEWTLADLADHVGRTHRWVGRIIGSRAKEPPPFPPIDPLLRHTPTAYSGWLRIGGAALSRTVRDAGPSASVWNWSADKSVGAWLQRITYDTLIHRMDAEIAIGVDPVLDSNMAAGGVADLLATIATLSASSHPDPTFAGLRGDGERLLLEATDSGDGWLVTRTPLGVRWTPSRGETDATLRGDALTLLLVLYRRAPVAQVEVGGDLALVEDWIAHSAF